MFSHTVMSFPFKLAALTAQVTYAFDHTLTHMHVAHGQIKMHIKERKNIHTRDSGANDYDNDDSPVIDSGFC